ncbi:hypothetical protein T10_1924 [Trichinella papuae]|uniref:Uncharacterized protein n=1 Tax=Trichinella papuae TaxID=268474 RepID=A0A0V1MTB8_9BILA|nr:hypothetical protein T10_1924 [Trichinella papuae]
MSKTNSIFAEKELAASKTRLKIMLQDLNRMCDESVVRISPGLSQESSAGAPCDTPGSAESAAPQESKETDFDLNVRLPRLELPILDGDVTRFINRGALGAALDPIVGLSASNQGYMEALRRLREHFDQPMMNKNKLSTICDEFRKKVYALTALRKNPRAGDLSFAEVLITLSREQLPRAVQFRWEEKVQANNEMAADLLAFIRFLQQQTDLSGALRKSEEPTHQGSETRQSELLHLSETTHAAAEPELASSKSP